MRVVHCKKSSYTVYIGRPSPFGNPHAISHGLSREHAISLYEKYARSFPKLLRRIAELPEDAVLGCWCHPLPCHGDIIIKLWKEQHGK